MMKVHTIIGYWQGLIEDVKTFKKDEDAQEFKKFLEDEWGLTEHKDDVRKELLEQCTWDDTDELENEVDRIVSENTDKEVLHYVTEVK